MVPQGWHSSDSHGMNGTNRIDSTGGCSRLAPPGTVVTYRPLQLMPHSQSSPKILKNLLILWQEWTHRSV